MGCVGRVMWQRHRQGGCCLTRQVFIGGSHAYWQVRVGDGPRRRAPLIGQLISVAVAAFALILVAAADERHASDSATLRFDIPEQPLVSALQAYSAASGVAILYSSGVDAGQRSPAIHGEYSREAALKMLLANTGLMPRYARADAIALIDPSASSHDEPPPNALSGTDMALDTLHVTGAANSAPDRDALADYVGVIQQDVQQALKKSGKTRDGSYRVGVNLWVDPSRTVRRADVIHSTGDSDRDAAIAAALQGVVIRKAAPARTPQPVRIMILVRSK